MRTPDWIVALVIIGGLVVSILASIGGMWRAQELDHDLRAECIKAGMEWRYDGCVRPDE